MIFYPRVRVLCIHVYVHGTKAQKPRAKKRRLPPFPLFHEPIREQRRFPFFCARLRCLRPRDATSFIIE